MWGRQPMVRPLIAILIGFLLADYFRSFPFSPIPLFLISILFLVYHIFFLKLNRSFIGLLIVFAFLTLGFIMHCNKQPVVSLIPEHKNYVFIVNQIDEGQINESKGNVRTILVVESRGFFWNKRWNSLKHRIRITIPGEFNIGFPGANYLIRASVKVPMDDSWPGSFNLSNFYSRKGIHAISNVDKRDIVQLSAHDSNPLRFVYEIKKQINAVLFKSGFNANQAGIASALLIGSRSDIDPDLNTAYSKAGIVHVLAVSGMHVGLVFGSVLWILGRFLHKKKAVLIGIAVLWCYALLAGMSASVVRSAWMFSLLASSNLLVKSSVSSNALAAAAFIMFWIEPNYIYDPGAQLSFAAVWGIQSRPNFPFWFKGYNNKIVKYLTDSLWICLVAQVATLPFTLAYFGNFPVYFLLANLIAVPLSTGLIYLGFIALLLAPLGQIAVPLFELMKFSIDCLNSMTLFISTLPFSSFHIGALKTENMWLIGFSTFIILFPFGSAIRKALLLLAMRLFISVYLFFNCFFQQSANVLYFTNCGQHKHILSLYNRKAVLFTTDTLFNQSCVRFKDASDFLSRSGMNLQFRFLQLSSSGGIVSVVTPSLLESIPIAAILPSKHILVKHCEKGPPLVWFCEPEENYMMKRIFCRLHRKPVFTLQKFKTYKMMLNLQNLR